MFRRTRHFLSSHVKPQQFSVLIVCITYFVCLLVLFVFLLSLDKSTLVGWVLQSDSTLLYFILMCIPFFITSFITILCLFIIRNKRFQQKTRRLNGTSPSLYPRL